MTMAGMADLQHVESYAVAPMKHHRKWRGKGSAKLNDQRYSKNTHRKAVKECQNWNGQGSGCERKSLQKQKRVKRRKFETKRRSVPRSVPRAPFNDSSFLMRVRRAGGLASPLVSPVCSSVFSSPAISGHNFGAYKDFLDHENVYGYGSMTDIIRLRATEGSSGSGSTTVANRFDDVNMCVERNGPLPVSPAHTLERRIDRFEMTKLPPRESEASSHRVARQDSRIRYLEDENLVLKDRLFVIQQEVNELKERLQGGQSSSLIQENDTQSCLDS